MNDRLRETTTLDEAPSWFGGPANTNPPRSSLGPTWGHSAAYKGSYNSKGDYAKDLVGGQRRADLGDQRTDRQTAGAEQYAKAAGWAAQAYAREADVARRDGNYDRGEEMAAHAQMHGRIAESYRGDVAAAIAAAHAAVVAEQGHTSDTTHEQVHWHTDQATTTDEHARGL